MTLIKVKRKAQITLPSVIRRALGIEEGDYLEGKRVLSHSGGDLVELFEGQFTSCELKHPHYALRSRHSELRQGNKVVLTPKTLITKLPPVTLSEDGERMLREALQDVEAGRTKEHDSVESLIEELHHEADQD